MNDALYSYSTRFASASSLMHLPFRIKKMIDVSNFSGETSVAWQYIQYGHRILIMQNCRSHQFTLL